MGSDNDLLRKATSVFGELLRMHKLNQELLETLSVTLLWVKDYAERHSIPIQNRGNLASLIRKAEILIKEISSPPFLQHRKRPTDKFTEPPIVNGG